MRELVRAGLQPVLSPHYQALKMLRTPDLKPFIVYVKAPSFERLRDTRTTAYARSTFVENGNRAFTVSLIHVVLYRFLKIRNRESRFLLLFSERRNCELKNDSFAIPFTTL